MSTEEKEQYKVLSDHDRKRFDTEKKEVIRVLKKRDVKEEEKKLQGKHGNPRDPHALESDIDQEEVLETIET